MHALFTALVARRLWIYGGGLAAVLLVRSTFTASTARSLLVAGALSVMVVTYAGEVWLDTDTESVGPVAVGGGVVGVAVGVFLTVGGDLRGLLFLAGGLLFLNRGLGGSGGDATTSGGHDHGGQSESDGHHDRSESDGRHDPSESDGRHEQPGSDDRHDQSGGERS